MTGGARPGSGRKPANFDQTRAIKLKEQGLSHSEIAERFAMSVHAIRYFFRKKNEKATHSKDQRTSA